MKKLAVRMGFEIFILAVIAFILVQAIIPAGESVVPEIDSSLLKPGRVIYSSSETSKAVVTGYRVSEVQGVYAGRVFKDGTVMSARDTDVAEQNLKEISRTKVRVVERQAVGAMMKKSVVKSGESGELLNPYVIERIIQNSDKTYRFTEKYIERQGVVVELISVTPRRDDYFLKVSIKNSSKDYFIPQAWGARCGNDWAEVERFFPRYLIEAGEEAVGYLRVKASYDVVPGRGDWVLQLQESGGAYRKFSIFY